MAVWWIDGVKDDAELAGALRQEAENQASGSVSKLLHMAADRLMALQALNDPNGKPDQ